MPVIVVNPNNKISPAYLYPPTGKVKIYLESSLPVDVFITNNAQADQIVSPQVAGSLGILSYVGVMIVNNQIVTLPPAWQGGWKLVIGNSNLNHAAVYYMVWNA